METKLLDELEISLDSFELLKLDDNQLKQFLIKLFSQPYSNNQKYKYYLDLINDDTGMTKVKRIIVDGITQSVDFNQFDSILINNGGIYYIPEHGNSELLLSSWCFYQISQLIINGL